MGDNMTEFFDYLWSIVLSSLFSVIIILPLLFAVLLIIDFLYGYLGHHDDDK